MAEITQFFSTQGACYLLESIYAYGYSDLKCCCLKENNTVDVFFLDLDNKKCGEFFLDLIDNRNRFESYLHDFRALLDDADDKSLLYSANIKSKELILLFIRFLSFYRFTEAFFTDYTYLTCGNREDIKNRLVYLEQLKTEGRKFLNSFFNGSHSYLSLLANATEEPERFLFSSVEEIINNQSPTDDIVSIRKGNHFLSCDGIDYSKDTEQYKEIVSLTHKMLLCTNSSVLYGVSASKGIIRGNAYVLNADFTNYDLLEAIINKIPDDIILVTETTSPDLVNACTKAIAIVTNQGGLGSHAAIISRELGIPCVVGTKIATKQIKTGDYIEVDGGSGEVRILDK